MKKLTAALAAFVALSSTVAFADTNTPAVREMNTFDTILKKASVKPNASNKASEFVIYHQDAVKPCSGHHGEAHHSKKHADKKAEHKAMHKSMHKKHTKKTKVVAKVKKESETTTTTESK